MTEQSQTILQLPLKNSANSTDQLVFISNAASANGGNVAIINVSTFFSNTSYIPVNQADPAHSNSWVGPAGILFFSNNYGYVSIANNTLLRFAANTF